MTSFTKPVLNVVPGLMSLALVGRASKMIPKDFGPNGRSSKKQTGEFIKGATGILVGVPLIGAVASGISGI